MWIGINSGERKVTVESHSQVVKVATYSMCCSVRVTITRTTDP